MIDARKNSQEATRDDLLSSFLLANASDGETESLSADEVISMSFHQGTLCTMLIMCRQYLYLYFRWS
jgi:hypothetical protein